MRRAKTVRNRCDLSRIRCLGDELAPQFGRDEGRRFRLSQKDVEHLIAIESAHLTENGLVTIVVDFWIELISERIRIEHPASVGPCGFSHVTLRVMSLA